MEEKDYSSLSYEQLSQISRDDHQEDVRQYDKQENALCLVVIGVIILVCGFLFLILSFVRRRNVMAGLDATSLPFFVSVGCFVISVALLTWGLVKFFKAFAVRKGLKKEIVEVTRLKTKMMTENK